MVSILITGFSTENVLYSGTVQHLQKKTSLIIEVGIEGGRGVHKIGSEININSSLTYSVPLYKI